MLNTLLKAYFSKVLELLSALEILLQNCLSVDKEQVDSLVFKCIIVN